jgi:hypothetical protein
MSLLLDIFRCGVRGFMAAIASAAAAGTTVARGEPGY